MKKDKKSMDLGENENENETQEYIRISNKEKIK